MAKSNKANQTTDDGPVKLMFSRAEANSKITSRIEEGKKLTDAEPRSLDELQARRDSYYIWDDYNSQLLLTMFSSSKVSREYGYIGVLGIPMHPTFAGEVKDFLGDVRRKIQRLESIRTRLDLFEEPEGSNDSAVSKMVDTVVSRQVFVVHGRDDEKKEKVARFLQKLRLEPIILHERPNRGKTIIEKFEANATDVGYVVVLLTPDDLGGVAGEGATRPRARQNVIFEFGFFYGALGRAKVCVLYSEGLELPSDASGIVWCPLDDHDAWKYKLADEIKAAGIDIDKNLI